MARPARALWSAHRLLQPLRPMAEGRRLGRADGRHYRRAWRRHPNDRQHLNSRPPAGRDGKKKGGADHCLGRSPGGLTTKIHIIVDARGLPNCLGLTAGQTHDGRIADTLLDHLDPRPNIGVNLLGPLGPILRARNPHPRTGAQPDFPAAGMASSCRFAFLRRKGTPS